MRYTDAQIAHVIHEANRALQIIQKDSAPSQPWWVESEEIRANAIAGVQKAREDMATPRDHHAAWVKDKEAHGWQWGPKKDAVLKTHPCMVPYDELPAEQQDKDRLFVAVVEALTHGMMLLPCHDRDLTVT